MEFERLLKKQGKNCSLKASITCELQVSGTPCESIEPLNVDRCSGGADNRYFVDYTVSYCNDNEEGNDIRFKTANKAGKELTFAEANSEPINIKRGMKHRARQCVSTRVKRRIDPCNFDMRNYKASIRLEGFLAGKAKRKQNRCFARYFYKEPIIRVVSDF